MPLHVKYDTIDASGQPTPEGCPLETSPSTAQPSYATGVTILTNLNRHTPKLLIRPYQESDENAVISLWQACGLVVPWNDPKKDIHRKLSVQRDLFLVGLIDNHVAAAVMAGYDGHRGWINYLAVDPTCQKQGYGRLMMDEAEARLRKLGCPKINLQVRNSNSAVIDFYKALGYTIDDVVSMGKRLDPDS